MLAVIVIVVYHQLKILIFLEGYMDNCTADFAIGVELPVESTNSDCSTYSASHGASTSENHTVECAISVHKLQRFPESLQFSGQNETPEVT